MTHHQQLNNSIQNLSMLVRSSFQSSDSFQLEASSSSTFGSRLPTCTYCEASSFESLEDLSLFLQSHDKSQHICTSLELASEEITLKVIPVPIRATQVKFSTVEIRTYAVVVGDNPSCADGLPISLDWGYNPKVKIEPVESEDMVHNSHYPAQRLSYFDRKLRLLEVSDIKVDDALQGKRAVAKLRLEGELEVGELPQMKRPKSLVSQAA